MTKLQTSVFNAKRKGESFCFFLFLKEIIKKVWKKFVDSKTNRIFASLLKNKHHKVIGM